LAAEKAAIHDWVLERRMPFLGLCLGHQLLAAALGGEVGPADRPEIGVLEANLTEAGRASPIFRGVPNPIRCLQWHSAEVKRLPAGAVILASSAPCRMNALSYGERAFGLQFHVEATPTTVRDWGAIPAYAAALERSLGPGALERLDAEASLAMPQFGVTAHRIYENFMTICRTAAQGRRLVQGLRVYPGSQGA
jgi:GMP synthase-like glutamine amidotransferase